MTLQTLTANLFDQLKFALSRLEFAAYCEPGELLLGASIGQHTRHIIELFIELNKGYETGVINYEHRERNRRIETDAAFAMQLMDAILLELDKPDKALLLAVDYTMEGSDVVTCSTNYYRELIYNIEHTVHHMALIRIGVNDVSNLELPEGFGVAVSTLKYRALCVQ